MQKKTRIATILSCLAVMTLSVTGCSSTKSLVDLRKDEFQWASASNPAVQIVTIWEPAEGNDLDGMPTRGFAGQLIFIGRDSTPLAIDGDMKIYVFDNIGTRDQQSKPIHRFDFSSDAWNLHLVNGSLGPSYNLFIPYTRKGEHRQVQCSLRTMFKTDGGQSIISEMVSVTLPGPKSDANGLTVEDSAIRQASAEHASEQSVDSNGIHPAVFEKIEQRYRDLQESSVPAEPANGMISRKSQRLGTIGANGQVNSISDSRQNGISQTAPSSDRIALLEAQLRDLRQQYQLREDAARTAAHNEVLDALAGQPVPVNQSVSNREASVPVLPADPFRENYHQPAPAPAETPESSRHPLEDPELHSNGTAEFQHPLR